MEVEDTDGLEKTDVDVGIELDPAVELYSDDRGSEVSDVAETMCDGGRYTLSGCWLPAIIMLCPTCGRHNVSLKYFPEDSNAL